METAGRRCKLRRRVGKKPYGVVEGGVRDEHKHGGERLLGVAQRKRPGARSRPVPALRPIDASLTTNE